MFSALAEPTMSAVPASESSSVRTATCPGARQAPAAPVTRTMAVIRGLVSATRSRISPMREAPRERGWAWPGASTKISVLATLALA